MTNQIYKAIFTGEYCVREGKDYYGGDIRAVENISNVTECIELCLLEPGCILATYNVSSSMVNK